MSTYRTHFAALILSAFVALAGCQSTSPSSSASPQKAVLISSGQGTTIVYVPDGRGGATALAGTKAEACPECAADAAAYFKTGALAPKCAACGSTRTVLTGTN